MTTGIISNKQKIVSWILKGIVVICAAVGVYLSAVAGGRSFMGGKVMLMYFTIQSNIAIAVIALIGAVLLFLKKPVGNVWFVIKFIGTISITLTGTVFCFALAPILGAAAWNIQNILTHVVVPIAAVADFFVTGISSRIRKRNVFLVLIPPLAYIIYAAICYVNNWKFSGGANYPYFFLNWGSPAGAFGFIPEFPFMGCVWWILGAFAALLLIALLYLIGIDLLKRVFRKEG